MADDALLDGNEGGGDQQQQNQPPPATSDDIQGLRGDLRGFAEQVASAVAQRQPAPNPTPPAALPDSHTNSQDIVDALLQNPREAIRKMVAEDPSIIQDQVDNRLREGLGPYINSQVADNYQSLLEFHQKATDSEYGDGVFDEVLKPEIEKIFEQMDQQGAGVARGSRQTFEAVLRQARGDTGVMGKLLTKREERAAALKDAPELLGGDRGMPARGDLTVEDLEWMKDYKDATGVSLDRKQMTDLLEVRRRSGSWNAQSMPGLKNALKVDNR